LQGYESSRFFGGLAGVKMGIGARRHFQEYNGSWAGTIPLVLSGEMKAVGKTFPVELTGSLTDGGATVNLSGNYSTNNTAMSLTGSLTDNVLYLKNETGISAASLPVEITGTKAVSSVKSVVELSGTFSMSTVEFEVKLLGTLAQSTANLRMEIVGNVGGQLKRDDHFNGLIDELRIWKLAREGRQLQLDKNAKLTGAEKGLVAYYPFEQYEQNMGIQSLKVSLKDNYVPPYKGDSNGGVAVANGGSFTSDAPNLKDARPVQDVAFDWVVNEDRIILNILEDPALIEQCILEFTVEQIEDLNENRIASPVTWTAFIKRNLVRWDKSDFEFEKEIRII